tara:strand:- start:18671 stop:19420 length:750 start_codon:yes stop_codon:yes gene_type:complete
MVKVGIIGGSGLDDPKIMDNAKEIEVDTTWGKPSSPLTVGQIAGVDVVLLARHGRKHQYSPTKVPWQANIQALKDQGVTHIIATTACGSLKEEIGKGHFVVLDQVIDFTKHRVNTFHEDFSPGLVHQPFADPFDEKLRGILFETGSELKIPMHEKGTVVTIEGPRFSSRAESFLFISWKADVINMSTATEVALANEAGIPYAAVAMSTDYDCWKEDEEAVTMDAALAVFKANASKVLDLLIKSIPKVGK